MAAPLFAVNDYVRALQALLPRGAAWPRDAGATLTSVLQGLAGVYAYTNERANNLLVVAFPSTVDDMLPEWNATLGLPGATGYTGDDLPTQQAQVVAALTDSGGQSTAYFIGLAARLGLTITITGYRPWNIDDPIDAPIYGPDWAHAWKVTATADGDYTALFALFERYKPAHTTIIWNVPTGGLLLESGDFLLTESGDRIALEF